MGMVNGRRTWPPDIESNFITHEKLRPDIIYIKAGNKVIGDIQIDSEWNMHGTIYHPGLFFSSYPVILTDAQCKYFLASRVAPPRPLLLEQAGLSEYDTMSLIYRTRGISYLDDIWLAWAPDDRAEDYHPRFNKDIERAYFPDISEI